jgi:NAD(P) transhydrogenase subunit alpha
VKIGIPKEIHEGECRVAVVPETVEKYVELGFEVAIEAGAGLAADFSDESYRDAGAEIVADAVTLWGGADLVLKVREPMATGDGHEVDLLKEGASLISFVWPAQNDALVAKLAERKATVLGMDAVPRITRAQKMDALSSMANIAGYRAVVEAAQHYGSFFAGQMTAAGRVNPAHVMVLGAGVAGLAAIAAARGLGAVVRAFDTREAVRDQVKSLGASFIDFHFEESGEGEGGYAKQMSEAFIEAEQKLLAENAAEVDIIISTALIPGKPAPVLITEEAIKGMKPGSVMVDLAAERGGNCPLSVKDEVVVRHGVTLIGYTDLPSRLAQVSSRLYAKNVLNIVEEAMGDEGFGIDRENEVIRGALILEEGEVTWPPPKVEVKTPAPAKAPEAKPAQVKVPKPKAKPAVKSKSRKSHGHSPAAEPMKGSTLWPMLTVLGVVLGALGFVVPADFLQHLTVFLLACVVGWHVIWNVSAALHTPLMSVTNAISGIILIGGMLVVGGELTVAAILGMVAILVASINVAGGFLVTQRMLRMFRK